jgi:hypothetical protein
MNQHTDTSVNNYARYFFGAPFLFRSNIQQDCSMQTFDKYALPEVSIHLAQCTPLAVNALLAQP